jgi:hypothetical protein
MTLLEKVKPRLGVFYSEANKDNEIQSMINGAIEYFKGAGWEIDPTFPSDLAIEAVTLYCKMAQSTDPSQFTNHPVLLSMVAQGRTVVPDVEV